eukprot:CAMPEP_0180196618 /NCGR_PEP_ID=MMETSP0987-20121128/4205_1 /TAXON_ID=697907 /ORGANISM="non described non described, Strain CCMP2293" /LENGTH=701 /DNA_ID=CAMNT_0022151515 /DNA_START=132 /DNA_END=2234 /DNA_ORIENTATION=-
MNGTGNKVAPEVDTPGGGGDAGTSVSFVPAPVTPANSMERMSSSNSRNDRRGSGTWMKGMVDFGAMVSNGLRRGDTMKPPSSPTENAGSLDLLMMSRIKIFASGARKAVMRRQRSANGLLLPDSYFRYAWDLLNLLCLGYTIFEIPYSMVFINSADPCEWSAHAVFNLAIDLFFLSDIACTLNTAILDEFGSTIVDRKVIIANYVSSWFVFDILSSFPIETVLCIAGVDLGDNAGILRVLKAFRFLKLARLLKIMRVLKKWDALAGSTSVTNFVKLMQFVCLMVGMAHICACIFFGITQWDICYVDPTDSLDQGVSVQCHQEPEGRVAVNWLSRYDPALHASPGRPESKYLASLYFTVATLSTVGYGDVTPTSDTERIYAVFLALLGAMVFALCIGSISSLANQGNHTESLLQTSNHAFSDFLTFNHIPRTLAAKAKRQHAHLTKLATHLVHPCMDELPRHTRNQIVWNSLGESVAQVPFFNSMNLDARARMVELLRPVRFKANDVIFSECDVGTEMFWVTDGVVDHVDLSGTVTAKIKVGELFGEVCMFPAMLPVRYFKARARTDVECLELRKEDFENFVKPWFPDLYQTIGDFALERLSYVDLDALKKELGHRSSTRCAILEMQAGQYRVTQKRLKRTKTTIVSNKTGLIASFNPGLLRPPSPAHLEARQSAGFSSLPRSDSGRRAIPDFRDLQGEEFP